VIGARRGAPRLFSWTFGTFYELAVKIRQKGAGGIGNLKNHSLEVVRMKRRHTFYVLMAQGLLFLWCFFATHHLYGYFILWFGPLFTVAVFLNRTRIVVEHGLAQLRHRRVPFAIAHKLPTIDIETNFLDRLFFSPFSFNYHSTHHLFPSIPFFNLKKASRLCELHNVEGHLCLRQTYLKSVSTILAD
jgi:fatty acid desaturase